MDCWNHNSAYHPIILQVAGRLHGDALDVGCGEGLLVERLATVSRHATGIDRDGRAIRHAELRTAALPNTTVTAADFVTMDVVPDSYDLVTFVAALHHMDLETALRRTRWLLRSGGQLVVVGLSANRSVGDYARSALLLPFVRMGSWIHHETRSAQVVVRPPRESFSEIRQTARRELPGPIHMRRALYYRYILMWTKP